VNQELHLTAKMKILLQNKSSRTVPAERYDQLGDLERPEAI